MRYRLHILIRTLGTGTGRHPLIGFSLCAPAQRQTQSGTLSCVMLSIPCCVIIYFHRLTTMSCRLLLCSTAINDSFWFRAWETVRKASPFPALPARAIVEDCRHHDAGRQHGLQLRCVSRPNPSLYGRALSLGTPGAFYCTCRRA
jgi:hypothetical protein